MADDDDLNLNIIAGKSSFDENSLANHEIIISDYAAFELRRTGYLGCETTFDITVVNNNTSAGTVTVATQANYGTSVNVTVKFVSPSVPVMFPTIVQVLTPFS